MTRIGDPDVDGTLQSEDDIDIDFWEVVRFVWDVRLWIVAGAAAGALVGLAIAFSRPLLFEATTLLTMSPAPAVSDMKNATTTKNLLDLAAGGFVRAKLVDDMEKAGVAPGGAIGRLSAIDDPQQSALLLAVQSDSAARAQAVANGWAAVIVREAPKADGFGPSPSASFVLAEFSKASDELAAARTKRDAEIGRHAAAVGELEVRSALAVKEAQLEALRRELPANGSREVEGRLASVAAELNGAKQSIERLRRSQEVELGPFNADVERAEARVEKLKDHLGEAEVELAQGATTVSVATPATLPSYPIPRRISGFVVPGVLFGAFAGLLISWVRGHLKQSRP